MNGCPNCGYCQHCGRGRLTGPYTPFYPLYPTYPPWPTYPWVSPTPWTLTAGDSVPSQTFTVRSVGSSASDIRFQ